MPAPRADIEDTVLESMWATEMPVKDIAHHLGVSVSWVEVRKAKLGLPKRTTRFKLDAAREVSLREWWEAGVTADAITERLGVGKNTLTRLRVELGLRPRPRCEPHDAAVLEAHERGLHPAAIGRKLGLSRERVRSSLRRAGVTPHRAESTRPLSKPGPKRGSGYAMRPEARERIEAQEVEAGCERCDWRMRGTLVETRKAFARHICVVAG